MTTPDPQGELMRRARRILGNAPGLIACCPVDTTGLPAELELPQPSLSHTIVTCAGESCGRDAWIGPTQLLAANEGLGVVLCYHCLVTNLGASFQKRSIEVMHLDPSGDDQPLRNIGRNGE